MGKEAPMAQVTEEREAEVHEEGVGSFAGREITKRVVNLGTAGMIDWPDDRPEMLPEAEVTFRAKAKVSAVKHKFLPHEKVEEATILTIDGASFEVLAVEEHEPEPELPFGEDGDEPEGELVGQESGAD